MGLQLADMQNDPLVKQTLKVFHDALSGSDYQPGGFGYAVPPVDEMPGVKALISADALDPVCAAVLAVGPLSQIISLADIETQLDPRVADTLRALDGQVQDGVEQLLASGNPHVLKLLVATIAGSTEKDELAEMTANMHPSEQRMMVSDLSDFILAVGERMTQTGRLEEIPPKLMDLFLEGIDNLAGIAPSRTYKRVLADIGRELKAEVARAAAAEITAEAPPPAIDPDSPFELLKENARKFKPGGMNG